MSPFSHKIAPVRLVGPYCFYDEAGALQAWTSGQLVSDAATVSMLWERGAPVESFYGNTGGTILFYSDPTIDPPAISAGLDLVERLFKDAKSRHKMAAAYCRMLDHRSKQFDRDVARYCQMAAALGDDCPAADCEAIWQKKGRVIEDAADFFHAALTREKGEVAADE